MPKCGKEKNQAAEQCMQGVFEANWSSYELMKKHREIMAEKYKGKGKKVTGFESARVQQGGSGYSPLSFELCSAVFGSIF